MTASSVDTAELPRVRSGVSSVPVLGSSTPLGDRDPMVALPATLDGFPAAAVAAVVAVALPADLVAPPAAVASTPGRLELRAERRQVRRQQRREALLGLAVLVMALLATVAVLDVIR